MDNPNDEDLNLYVALCAGKRGIEIRASTSFAAYLKAVDAFNVPEDRKRFISVYLSERGAKARATYVEAE